MKLGCISLNSVQRVNKLRHSQIGFAQRFYHCQETWSLHIKKTIELFGLVDNDEAEALRKVNNPRGETKLYFDVVRYIKKKLSPCYNHTRLMGEPDNTF